MSRRRTSSPYSQPPTGFVRALTRVGWRRCDAEAMQTIWLCLTRAATAADLGPLAGRVSRALAREPVLAGFVHRFAGEKEFAGAALQLMLAAPSEQRPILAQLFLELQRRSVLEAYLEQLHCRDSMPDELREAG